MLFLHCQVFEELYDAKPAIFTHSGPLQMLIGNDYETNTKVLVGLVTLLLVSSIVISEVLAVSVDCSREVIYMMEGFGILVLISIVWEGRLPVLWKDNTQAIILALPALMMCIINVLDDVNMCAAIALTCLIHRTFPGKAVICFLAAFVIDEHTYRSVIAGVLLSVSGSIVHYCVARQGSLPIVLYQLTSFKIVFHFSMLYFNVSQRILVLTDGPFYGFSPIILLLVAASICKTIILWILVSKSVVDRDCAFLVSLAIVSQSITFPQVILFGISCAFLLKKWKITTPVNDHPL